MRNGFVGILAALLLLPSGAGAQGDKSGKEKKTYKPQASVAAKDKAFGKADAAAAKSATKAEDLGGAKTKVGKTAAFTGTVAKVFEPKSNSVVVLNFAEKYWTAVTAVVKAEDYAKFPPLRTLKGKKVIVTGKVTEYDKKMQIELTDASQIKILP